jgi:hypothetical protein
LAYKSVSGMATLWAYLYHTGCFCHDSARRSLDRPPYLGNRTGCCGASCGLAHGFTSILASWTEALFWNIGVTSIAQKSELCNVIVICHQPQFPVAETILLFCPRSLARIFPHLWQLSLFPGSGIYFVAGS